MVEQMNAMETLGDMIGKLPKEILDLEVVEVCGSDPDSIHITRMSTSLSYGLVATINGKPARDTYFQVGVFPDFDSATIFANDLERYLRAKAAL